jgi:hypothetical protein
MHDPRHYYASLPVSDTANPSRPCNVGLGMPPQRRHWTPTRTYGLTRTIEHVTLSMRCWAPPCSRRAPRNTQDDIAPGEQGGADELACKPDPVCRAPRDVPDGGHPSRPAVAGRLQRPTRRHRAGHPRSPAQHSGSRRAFWPCSRWGLPSRPGHPGRWWSLTPPFHPYPGPVDLMGRGGLFSVALSRGSPRVAVSNHPALRSPDFPRRARPRTRRDRPASSSATPA